jgi:1-phosphofructokinase
MSGQTNRSPIVTLTPAPTLDRTYFVTNLHSGAVNRADNVAEELAGKGINVSRGLHLAGIDAPGIVPIGNSDPGVLVRTGSAEFLTPLWVDGTLRVSTTILEHGGTTTKVNETPRPLSHEDWDAIVELTDKTVRENGAKWLVVAGALPTYKESGEYVSLKPIFERMKAQGVKVALDTSGEPLSYWAHEGCATLMKPNAEELAFIVGRNLTTLGDVVAAAREVNAFGVEVVLASLGGDGMVAVTKDNVWSARTAPVKVINTVGAGDATLAGFLSAVVSNPIESGEDDFGVGYNIPLGVKTAVQWGAMAVTQPTSGLTAVSPLPEGFLNLNPDLSTLLDEPAVGKPH